MDNGFRIRVALIIPVFNEAQNIKVVLEEIQVLKKSYSQWEFLTLVVNDGSTDDSAEILELLSCRMDIQVIHLPFNLGIGKAIQKGFELAEHWAADVFIQLDGDGQHPPSQIPYLIQPVLGGEANVAVGSRYVPGGGGNVSTLLRELGTNFFSILLRILCGIKIRDTTSGFRAWDPTSMKFAFKNIADDYSEIGSYVSLVRAGFKIMEIPVDMRPRMAGVSSIEGMKSIYYALKMIVSVAFNTFRAKKVAIPATSSTNVGQCTSNYQDEKPLPQYKPL